MILSICELPEFLKVVKIVKIVITIIKIVVPILLMISAMIDLVKAVTNAELNKMTKPIVTKVVAAILVFMIPTLVDVIFTITMTEKTYNNCFTNATDERIRQIYIENMDALIEKAKKEETTSAIGDAKNYLVNIKDQDLKDKYQKEIDEIEKALEEKRKKEEEERKKKQEQEQQQEQQPIQSGNVYLCSGTYTGTKFTVSEDDLFFITKVSLCEQGTVKGAATEASLIANRYDLYGHKKYNNITDYVRNSGWWSCAKTKRTINVKDEHIAAVRNVIVNGVRTVPLYVDEHDCFDCNKSLCPNGNRGDICKLVTNGVTTENMADIKNRGNYISGKTREYNKYGGSYTFYCFATEKSDPFGYTDRGYKLATGSN